MTTFSGTCYKFKSIGLEETAYEATFDPSLPFAVSFVFDGKLIATYDCEDILYIYNTPYGVKKYQTPKGEVNQLHEGPYDFLGIAKGKSVFRIPAEDYVKIVGLCRWFIEECSNSPLEITPADFTTGS